MKSRGAKTFITALACTVAGSAPASAHHSFAAAYNMDNPIEIVGSIVEVRLTNPHSHFFPDVEDADGNPGALEDDAGVDGRGGGTGRPGVGG